MQYYLAPLIIENLVLRNVLKILKTQVLSDYKHQWIHQWEFSKGKVFCVCPPSSLGVNVIMSSVLILSVYGSLLLLHSYPPFNECALRYITFRTGFWALLHSRKQLSKIPFGVCFFRKDNWWTKMHKLYIMLTATEGNKAIKGSEGL